MLVYLILVTIFVAFIGYSTCKGRKFSAKLMLAAGMIGTGIGAIAMYPLLFIGILLVIGGILLRK